MSVRPKCVCGSQNITNQSQQNYNELWANAYFELARGSIWSQTNFLGQQ